MKLIFRLSLIIIFVSIIVLTIAYSRGYRWSFKEGTITTTGIISVNSNPNAAKVYVNGVFKGVTNINITLPPGSYQIEIKKEGFASWTKEIKLQGELVYNINTQLFPINPSLTPLTNLGLVKAIPIDETEKIILFSESNNPSKDGIYLFETGKKPFMLFPPLKLIKLKTEIPITNLDFQKTEVFFSPDYKEAIFNFNSDQPTAQAYLISLEDSSADLFDVTNSKETLISAWEEERNKEMIKILETFPKEMAKIATDSFSLISFSPNKTKVLYQAKTNLKLPFFIKSPLIATNQTPEQRSLKTGGIYVYDKKEDKNYYLNLEFIIQNSESINKILNSIQWYPDSNHLIFFDKTKILVVDYDGLNKQTVYSGPFEKPFFVVTTDGNIIILANLNPENNLYPDLYLVGIK